MMGESQTRTRHTRNTKVKHDEDTMLYDQTRRNRKWKIQDGGTATHTFSGPTTRWDWTDVYDFRRRLDW